MNSVYFIAVNYNNSKYTIKFIKSVFEMNKSFFSPKVVIVDNNSSQPDKDNLKRSADLDNVEIIFNPTNIGYFPALNVGLSSVPRKSYIVIGNNDLQFDKNFLTNLNALNIGSDTLAIAPNVITSDGFNQNPHLIKRVSKKRKLGYDIYYSNYHFGQFIYWLTQKYKSTKGTRFNCEANNAQFIYMGIGACYILTEHFYEFYSRLDDRVFMWGEEALFANQIASVGGKIWYEPCLVVHHNESVSISKMPTRRIYDISKESYKIFSQYL